MVEGARMTHERETARDIVSMLKAGLMVMPNDRSGHPLKSYQQNTMSPGVNWAIGLIESAFNLKRE